MSSGELPYEITRRILSGGQLDIDAAKEQHMPQSGWGVIRYVESTQELSHAAVVAVFGNEDFSEEGEAEERARAHATELNETWGVSEEPTDGIIPVTEVHYRVAPVEQVDVAVDLELSGTYQISSLPSA